MKNILLKNKFLVSLILIVTFSCKEEQCIDIADLDKKNEMLKEWYVNEDINNQTVKDKNGISQTLIISSRDTHIFNDAVIDDCGQSFNDFRFSIQYNTSLSPIHFIIVIDGSTLEEDGFTLKLTLTNIKRDETKSTTYDFVTASCRENNAKISILEQFSISNKKYNDVMKINFNKNFSLNDIKTVYFAKGYGIIKFEQNNGNSFEVE